MSLLPRRKKRCPSLATLMQPVAQPPVVPAQVPVQIIMVQPEERLLRFREVEKKVSFGRTTIYKLIREGTFPRPLKLTLASSRWRLSDIQAFIDGKYKGGKA